MLDALRRLLTSTASPCRPRQAEPAWSAYATSQAAGRVSRNSPRNVLEPGKTDRVVGRVSSQGTPLFGRIMLSTAIRTLRA
jgi:hypothetical protein